jgi:GH25 family lysozyme M1 (1,4-beta-N-acetylmuramidase)
MILGIDLASHQGPSYDFARARREGREFAIVKASGGHTYRNEYLDRQVANARGAGLLVGFYHYMGEPTSGGGDVDREFANFRDAVRPHAIPGTTLWLDVEEWPASFGYRGYIGDFVDRFATLCEAEFGCPCGVYTGTYYIVGTGMLQDTRLARLPLWIASWQDVVPGPQYLQPWDRAAVWQNDAYTIVAGQQTDTDVFFGTREDLQALGIPFAGGAVAEAISGGVPVTGEARADGAMSPIRVTFDNPHEPGFGIPYKVAVWVYNPDTHEFYQGEWEMGEYKPWVKLG